MCAGCPPGVSDRLLDRAALAARADPAEADATHDRRAERLVFPAPRDPLDRDPVAHERDRDRRGARGLLAGVLIALTVDALIALGVYQAVSWAWQ